MKVSFKVNGKKVSVEAPAMARLLDVLRESLRLTGSKEGCGEGECGACSVLVDGELVNSCLVPVAQMEGATIRTIEGLDGDRLQRAFLENGGAQCGICTPGMIMAAYDLLKRNKKPSEAEIRDHLAGNLCRCTGYVKIVDSIAKAARMRG